MMLLASLVLACVICSCLGQLSPQEHGLQPGASLDDLPPPDLIEAPNKLNDPRAPDLNATILRTKLGRNLDPTYMSILRPRHAHQHFMNHSGFPFRRNRNGRLVPLGEMPRHLKETDFKFIRLSDGSRLRTRVSARLRRKLQQLLWAYTACPISYRWKDLGLRFWPRWLKEGHCPAGKTSCSIPPGMKCRASGTVHKTILRWHCRPPAYEVFSKPLLQRHCHWIKVEYPIVTQCACACPSGPYS